MVDFLFISGWGRSTTNPEPGLGLIGSQLRAAGFTTRFAGYNDLHAIQLEPARVCIGHSLGGFAAVEHGTFERLVLLDPVRPWLGGWWFGKQWDMQPLEVGATPTLCIRSPKGLPRSVAVSGDNVTTIETGMGHNELVADGLSLFAIRHWIKATELAA